MTAQHRRSLCLIISLCCCCCVPVSSGWRHTRVDVGVVVVVDKTNSTLYTPPTSYTTYLCDGVPISSTDGTACVSGKATSVTTYAIGAIGSLSALVQSETRDDYAYRPGYYFDSTGCVKSKSVFDCVKRGTTVDLYSEFSGFNPIMLNSGASYSLSNAAVNDVTSADGKDTCDFSGLGAGIAVYGGTKLSITDTSVIVRGVAKPALYVDSESIVTVQNCKLTSYGGTLYSDYENTISESYMVSSPWALGLMGTSRTLLALGDHPTVHVIESEVTAAQWGVLSLDIPAGPAALNVVNSKITLLGADYLLQQPNSDGTILYQTANPYTNRSGYGTYVIGVDTAFEYGVTVTVGTYVAVLSGGQATFTSLVAGETYTLYDSYGSISKTYTATESKVSTLVSDTFGFMAREFNCTLLIEEGTVVTSGWTSLLVKTGCSASFYISSGSIISPGNGILLQVMDDDDLTTGKSDSENVIFNTFHSEEAGWPTPTSTGSMNKTSLTLDDVTVTGDIYNGAGYYGQSALSLEVKLTNGATLNAAIAATATIHVTYEGNLAIKSAQVKASEEWISFQNTYFTISEYFDIGQVANKVFYNGHNDISVTVGAGCTWVVTAPSLITSLSNSGTVYGELTTNDDGTITVLPGSIALPIGSW